MFKTRLCEFLAVDGAPRPGISADPHVTVACSAPIMSIQTYSTNCPSPTFSHHITHGLLPIQALSHEPVDGRVEISNISVARPGVVQRGPNSHVGASAAWAGCLVVVAVFYNPPRGPQNQFGMVWHLIRAGPPWQFPRSPSSHLRGQVPCTSATACAGLRSRARGR
jgi:hypothetical protein